MTTGRHPGARDREHRREELARRARARARARRVRAVVALTVGRAQLLEDALALVAQRLDVAPRDGTVAHDDAAADHAEVRVAPGAAEHEGAQRILDRTEAKAVEGEGDEVGGRARGDPAEVGPVQCAGTAERGGLDVLGERPAREVAVLLLGELRARVNAAVRSGGNESVPRLTFTPASR